METCNCWQTSPKKPDCDWLNEINEYGRRNWLIKGAILRHLIGGLLVAATIGSVIWC
jgi:hypothetical protein